MCWLPVFLLVFLLPGPRTEGFSHESLSPRRVSPQRISPGGATDTVDVFTRTGQGVINPMMMGFNTVYCYAPDDVWNSENGKIPALLGALGTRLLRYPAGTVVTYFHWEHPTGQGWKDSWDPAFNAAKNTDPASFMDVHEYLDICRRYNIEPLLGINMASGIKYDRVEEGIEEAKRLMLHCRDRGIKVRYYYLGNEPYHDNANYTFTASEYAEMISRYTQAMQQIDPDIRIIVNTHPRNLDYTSTLIREAGKYIDYIDIHYYWKWGNATYANWQAEPVMRQGRGLPYREQRAFYRKLADSLGHPGIDLVSLEWNIGVTGKGNQPPTEAQAALMAGEQFIQFIQSGMPMATFWTTTWPKKSAWDNRLLLDARNGASPNKMYDMFALFRDIPEQRMVKNRSSREDLHVLSVSSLDNDTLWIYLLNKKADGETTPVVLRLHDFSSQRTTAVSFTASDNTPGKLRLKALKSHADQAGNLCIELPAWSLTKLILTK